MPDYLTTDEVAEICRAPVSTVRYWRFMGTGPTSFKIGRRVLYARTDVERFLNEMRSQAIPAAAS